MRVGEGDNVTASTFTQMSYLHTDVLPSHRCPTFTQTSYLRTDVLSSHRRPTFTQMSYLHTDVLPSHRCPTFTQMSYLHTDVLSSHRRPTFTQMSCLHTDEVRVDNVRVTPLVHQPRLHVHITTNFQPSSPQCSPSRSTHRLCVRTVWAWPGSCS